MKRILVFFILLVIVGKTTAQIPFGIKAGLNISNLQLTSPSQGLTKFTPISAFNGGVQVSIPITHNLYLQPEIMYSGHGGTMNGYTIRYDYLNFPLLIKYQTKYGLFAEAGMQPSFLTRSSEPEHGRDGNTQRSPDDNCWVLGGGYKIPKTHVGIDIRYYQSFSAFYTVNGQNIYGKNSVFQFDLFYVF